MGADGVAPAHDAGWYDQRGWAYGFDVGDRMVIPCGAGAPCLCRVEHFPPRLEIPTPEGTFVLVDDGEPHTWTYDFVAAGI